MPLSIARLSAHKGYKGVSVERGLAGDTLGIDSPYVALCHYLFDTVEDFLAAFTPHAELIQGDIHNYTDITPVIQISAVEIAR